MKNILTALLFLIGLSATAQQVVVTVDGYIKVLPQKKDTVFLEKVIVKDSIIYRDKIVYVDRVIYKDTCTTTQPGKIDYLSLPLSGQLDLSGKSNIIVEGKRFANINGVGIKLYSGANNIIIRNCFFQNIEGEMVELENATNITIENCLFAKGWSGVYALASSGIKIINCQFVNMKMKPGTSSRGQFVQMNACSNYEILNCKGENFEGESNPEDLISAFKSSNGIIRGNMFRGGGPSTSGGGINIGDNGGNNNLVENNTVLNPGQYGLAISGGSNNRILNNKIYSVQKPWSNNPLYMWAQGGVSCSDNRIEGNFVNWTDKNGIKNNGWNAGNCSNSIYNPSLNKTITLVEMNVPDHLIDFVTPDQLLLIRK